MRMLLIAVVFALLGLVFMWQKQNDRAQTAATATTIRREVSEHDWAKQALDKTAKVKQQVLQQRRENQVP